MSDIIHPFIIGGGEVRKNPFKVANSVNGSCVGLLRPMGVVASITPWNWPLTVATWQIISAIRTVFFEIDF